MSSSHLSCSDFSLSVSHPCRHDVGVGSVPDLVNLLWVLLLKSTEKFVDRYNDFCNQDKTKTKLKKMEYLV